VRTEIFCDAGFLWVAQLPQETGAALAGMWGCARPHYVGHRDGEQVPERHQQTLSVCSQAAAAEGSWTISDNRCGQCATGTVGRQKNLPAPVVPSIRGGQYVSDRSAAWRLNF